METHNQTITQGVIQAIRFVCLLTRKVVSRLGEGGDWEGIIQTSLFFFFSWFINHSYAIWIIDLSRDDSLNFRVNCSSCSFLLSFQVVHLQGGANTRTAGKYIVQKIRKAYFYYYFFFGEADFLQQVEKMKPSLQFFLAGFLSLILQTGLCYGIKWM